MYTVRTGQEPGLQKIIHPVHTPAISPTFMIILKLSMANNTASEYLLSQAETSSIVHRLIESKVVGLSVVTILALVFYKQHFKKIPLPDVPFLRLSKLSGAAGESEDAASYMENGSLVMQAGWEQVR